MALGAFAGLSRRLSQDSELTSPLLADALVLAWFGAGGLTVVLLGPDGPVAPELEHASVGVTLAALGQLRRGARCGDRGATGAAIVACLGWLTLRASAGLLGLIHSDLVYRPSKFILGTPGSEVLIAVQCSGFEGMGLLAVVARRVSLVLPQRPSLSPCPGAGTAGTGAELAGERPADRRPGGNWRTPSRRNWL